MKNLKFESKSKLFILGTPIGNLEDITIRGLHLIFESDVILAEDTRVFYKFKDLLRQKHTKVIEETQKSKVKSQNDHSISIIRDKQIVLSYREQNHARVINSIISFLKEGKVVTQITDAGMPGISDPGYELVDAVLKAGFEVDVIPGPTSVETALIASGLSTDRYVFLGFLPRTKSKMIKLLKAHSLGLTAVVFESPYRVLKTLVVIQNEFGDNVKVAACNDLTKKFQKVYRGKINEVIEQLTNEDVRGEWVLVFKV